jgi:hypothetical protein
MTGKSDQSCLRRVLRLVCEDLVELHCGTLYLSVPVVNDVIQVGIGGDFATTILRVSIDPTAVTVRRLDGKAMQVHILRDDQESSGELQRMTSAYVFREPVVRITLQRAAVREGRGGWEAAGTANINRRQDFRQFVYTIARFGLAKQRRLACQPASA